MNHQVPSPKQGEEKQVFNDKPDGPVFNSEKVVFKILIKRHQKNRIKQENKSGDKPMSGFNSTFRTIAHTFHAALAVESPKRTVVDPDNCFHGTLFNTKVTIIAIG